LPLSRPEATAIAGTHIASVSHGVNTTLIY
jgi:hypothetical protein